MKQEIYNKRTTLRFNHFSRKGYALFSCLGRVVLVGVLSVSTLTFAKAEGVSNSTAIAADTLTREEMKLDEVLVIGSRAPLTELQSAKIVSVVTRDDIARAAAGSINDVLKLVTGVDVRQRGSFGVQTDISVRGGNFDQIAILLNGINISSPHTGHLSADFPVSTDDIERIEVLEGPASRIFGASAFNGVVNIITRSKSDNIADVHISSGSYGYVNSNASLHASTGIFSSNVSGGYTRSDGATNNSAFESSRFFWQGKLNFSKATINAQMGYSYKPYEANTFYGASSTDQWESNERLTGAVNAEVVIGKIHLSPQVYWNRWFDHYQWHKDNPAGENYHKVDATGAGISAWFDSFLGKTSVGGDIRREGIWSTKLGLLQEENQWQKSGGQDANESINYKYNDARTIASAFIEHNILLNNWTLSMGATVIHSPFGGWGVYPGLDISYRPSLDWKLFAAYNTGMRLPTFTDLYYSGAKIEGNSNLRPEKTSDFQLGARKTGRGYVAEAQLFYSHKTDMIDWVTYKEADDDIFHSVNFIMNNWGGDLNIALFPRELFTSNFPVKKLSARYSYINEDSKYDVTILQSKYAMEYLRNKVVLATDLNIWKNLNLNISLRWQDRIGINNSAYSLLDARLSWDRRKWSVYVDGTNILNKEYFDYVSIKQPGIVIIGGIKIKI